MSTYLFPTLMFVFIFLASIISIELGLAAAIIEIALGVIAGSFFHLQPTVWMIFLASFGSAYLTFLAGTEIDIPLMKKNRVEAVLIGGLSFFVPLITCFLFAYYGFHWTFPASKIAGIALSTTSVAVVYSVLVETGLSVTNLGKRIMAATFVTDILTVIVLTFSFFNFNTYTIFFIIVSLLAIFLMPKIYSFLLNRYNGKVIQPDIKFLFLVLFLIEWLGDAGKNQPGLPIFILGLAMSGLLAKNPAVMKKMRVVSFAAITPFFFLKGGMNVDLNAVWAGAVVMLIFLSIKLGSKFVAVFPLAKKYHVEHGMFTTLLMSTGLTFGTITSLYGLSIGAITKAQFSILITVVILSAIIPTAIALRFFKPITKELKEVADTEGEEG
ncbi:MAG: cation:proton antiporter [bacterium]|nr:cation:proton antiporter [bacterium]